MWPVLAPIIAQYGLPLAEKVWRLAASGKDPTEADWDELNALAEKPAAAYLAEAQARAALQTPVAG